MDRLFLDANILFSAAWRPESGLLRLWELDGVRLIASPFVVAEARRNLPDEQARQRIDGLLAGVTVLPVEPAPFDVPDADRLPAKDRPVLVAAVMAGADYLLTGDLTHFGPLMGTRNGRPTVMLPGKYLAQRA